MQKSTALSQHLFLFDGWIFSFVQFDEERGDVWLSMFPMSRGRYRFFQDIQTTFAHGIDDIFSGSLNDFVCMEM